MKELCFYCNGMKSNSKGNRKKQPKAAFNVKIRLQLQTEYSACFRLHEVSDLSDSNVLYDAQPLGSDETLPDWFG